MSDISHWFEETFKDCYCAENNLVDRAKFKELVQLVLDDEADEKSRALFEEKIRTCISSNSCFEDEKGILNAIRTKLADCKSEMPSGLAQSIKNSISS
jgi:hypothetical protein